MAQLLPMEENFLLLFRFDNPLDSSVEFMKVSAFRILHLRQPIITVPLVHRSGENMTPTEAATSKLTSSK